MQGVGSQSIKHNSPTFTQSSDDSLVSGHIEYEDQRKKRIIYFSEKEGKFMLYSCTLDANDVFMAAKAIQWILANLLTYDNTRLNFCKYVMKMLQTGKILMFLTTTLAVNPTLILCLERCHLPVHVVQWSGSTSNFAADELQRIFERLPVFFPTPAVVEAMHDLNRAPQDQFIRVSSQMFEAIDADFQKCALERREEWCCIIPAIRAGLSSIAVVHDKFEFVERLSWSPIVSDASLDSLDYMTRPSAEEDTKKIKMSEQMRRIRRNR
tara:strand:+ start:161 stop:961 length:801 start_codon:yes stop_codon:yes gene_type:complete